MRTILAPLRRNSRGFTLVEIMISVTIIGLTSIGIIGFLRQGLKMYYADRARLMINRDIRTFTDKIDTDAVDANFFCLYPSFATTYNGSGGTATDAAVADGQVGDFLVLVFVLPKNTSGVSLIYQIVGYYREVTNTTLNTGPVHRFSVDLSANPVDVTSAPMYSILATYVTGSASSYPVVTQLAQGLATPSPSVTPALFYNFQNRSVMVNAQISESLSENGLTTTAGNTYNFSVSPRG